MLHVHFKTYNNYVTDSLYQWDVNQDLVINGLNLGTAPEIHFANSAMDKAIVRQATVKNGVITVRIPNSLLQSALTIRAYVGIYEGNTFKGLETIEIPIIARTRPVDYAIEDADEEIYSFIRLENMIANIIAHNNDTDGNTELVDLRADYEGTIHPSAGAAIRYQIAKIAKIAQSGGVSDAQLEAIVKKYLDQTTITAVPAKIGYVTLKATDWVGEASPYSQVVNVDGATNRSQVDLTPSVEQLSVFYNKNLAFVTENDNGVITVYAVGQKPENDYTIQVTITEVAV